MTNQVVLANTMSDSAGVTNYATGQLQVDGGTPIAITLAVGFTARMFRLVCIASATAANVGREIEWLEGMPNGSSLLTSTATPPVRGYSANGLGPTVTANTITIPATALDSTASYVWEASA